MTQATPPIKRRWTDGTVATSPGTTSIGLLPAVLLHGAGASGYDEILIFGGIGLVIAVLVYLSWRTGRKSREERRKRRRPR